MAAEKALDYFKRTSSEVNFSFCHLGYEKYLKQSGLSYELSYDDYCMGNSFKVYTNLSTGILQDMLFYFF